MLDGQRPRGILDVVRRLTFLQLDPTAAIAPSADLVIWSRLGSSYRPADLKRELEEKRTLFELDAMVRPMSDVALYLASAKEWTDYDEPRNWMKANDKFRRDVLKLLRRSGPLPSREIPDTCAVPCGVDRLDERSQRHADARVHGSPRRGRDRGARRARADLGFGGARLSEGQGADGGTGP